jgi:cytochrome c556
MQEGEMTKAAAAWEAFKVEYAKVAEMVPEWSDQFPQQPIDDLDQALQSGDPATIGQAMGGLGKVCGDCHHTNMPAVWYNYVYKDVEEINIDDPVGGQPLSFEDYMHGLSGMFSATDTYLKEAETSGDFTKAQEALSGFSQMLEGLKEGCKECHGQQDERRYFVDADIFGLLSQAEAELAKNQPDLAVIGQALQGVGGGSCYPCHVTHLPAAAVKHAWNPEEGH